MRATVKFHDWGDGQSFSEEVKIASPVRWVRASLPDSGVLGHYATLYCENEAISEICQ
jgi:hypothetical protein